MYCNRWVSLLRVFQKTAVAAHWFVTRTSHWRCKLNAWPGYKEDTFKQPSCSRDIAHIYDQQHCDTIDYVCEDGIRAETVRPALKLTNSNPGLKQVSLNAFNIPGWTFCFLGSDRRSFLRRRVKTCLMATMSPLRSPNLFLSSHL